MSGMMAANRWDQLLAHWDEQLRRAFLESVYALRDQAQINKIAERMEAGDVEGAIRAVGLDPVLFRPFDRTIETAFEAGGNATAKLIPTVRDAQGFKVTVSFAIRNPSAERWLRDHSSRFVTEVMDDQRQMIREHLRAGMAKGLNPRTVALDLVGRINAATGRREGGVIGLTNSQAEWVRNYADELSDPARMAQALTRSLRDRRFDPAVRKAIESGEPIPAELRGKMERAYKNRALQYRAEAIARTEAMAALHQAQDEAMQQAISGGAVDVDAVTFIWRTASDNRVRDSHASMDGQEVREGEDFITGNGARLQYPGDPNGPIEEIINCFPAGTAVNAVDIEAGYRRWYDGALIEIKTASGRKLAGTPNHPVLTRRGWVGLGELHEGDDIICRGLAQEVALADPDVKDVPSGIEEIFASFAQSGNAVRSCGSPMDFHGDGAYRNVDIVFPARLLRGSQKATQSKPFDHLAFERANNPALCEGSVVEFGFTAFNAPDGGMGRSSLALSLDRAHARPFDEFCFASAPDRFTALHKNGSNPKAANSKTLGSGLLGMSGPVEGDHGLSNRGSFGPVFGNNASPVGVGEIIVQITRSDYRGHVYNLETKSGWYIANGIIVHNCRCWREPKIDHLRGIE